MDALHDIDVEIHTSESNEMSKLDLTTIDEGSESEKKSDSNSSHEDAHSDSENSQFDSENSDFFQMDDDEDDFGKNDEGEDSEFEDQKEEKKQTKHDNSNTQFDSENSDFFQNDDDEDDFGKNDEGEDSEFEDQKEEKKQTKHDNSTSNKNNKKNNTNNNNNDEDIEMNDPKPSNGIDKSEEAKPSESRSIPNELYQLFRSIKQPGDFSEHGNLDFFASPGLEVEGIGMIGLPLSEHQAQQLKQKCEQAPFGRGEKTMLDTTVRKTLQLHPSKFKLNETFQRSTIQDIQAKLQQGLGVGKRQVHLELYKLLLYDEGSFFKKHRDSEKSDGMFATLVVLLPSVYEGGEIIIYHGDEKRSIDLSKQNKHQLGWISFYADCEHEVLPLKSGYRLALVYNVCFSKSNESGENVVSGVLENSFKLEFEKLFEEWKTNPSLIGIRLEHSYSEKSLKISHLKNGDYSMLSSLKTLSKYFPLNFYLVTIKRTNSMSEYSSEVRGDTYLVDHWVNLNDEEVGLGEVAIDPKCLFPKKAFRQIQSYKERSEDTGNEGTVRERWYRFGFLLIWPPSFTRSMFSSNNKNVLSIFRESLSQAQIYCPQLDKANEKWKKVLSLVGWLGDLHPNDAVSVINVLNEIDSIDDPIQRNNTKQFISSRRSILGTSSDLLSQLELIISQFGGWPQWKQTILLFARNLERPWALLIWLLNECSAVRPVFIKSNEEREEIRSLAKELVQSKPIRPPMCLVISKLGDISLAKKMISKFLKSLDPDSESDENEMSFPHINSLLQGFGFDERLCEIVQNFMERLGMNEEKLNAIWSMFFQQSSLRRLRIESAKNIVRFGRLIGSSKSLSNRKLATLKLVLNEFGASRLSAKETNELILGSFDRSTFQHRLSSNDDFPSVVSKVFTKDYLKSPKQKDWRWNSSTVWDKPRTSLNDDMLSDGPSGIGGVAKRRFASSLLSMVYGLRKTFNYNLIGITSFQELLSLSAFVSDWEKFKQVLFSIEKANLESSADTEMFFINTLVVACRNFQANHYSELIELLKIAFSCLPHSPSSLQFVKFVSDREIEQNARLFSELLVQDDVFWRFNSENISFCTDWIPLVLKLDEFQNGKNEKEKNRVDSEQQFVVSNSKLQQIISKRPDGILNRLVQCELLSLPLEIETFSRLVEFVTSTFKTLEELKQAKLVCQTLLDAYFETLFSNPDKESRYSWSFNLDPKQRPPNADATFRQIIEAVFSRSSVSLGIVLKEYAINVLGALYATPDLTRAFLTEGKVDKTQIFKLIDCFIPPIPFPVQPTQNGGQFLQWLSSEINGPFPYSLFNNGTFSQEISKFKYSKYFTIRQMMGQTTALNLIKRWPPYLKLKQEFSTETKNASQQLDADTKRKAKKPKHKK